MEIHAIKSVQDRSFEFQQAVNTFAKQNHTIGQTSKTNNAKKPRNEFNKQAGQIAKEIVKVTGSLNRLAQLAKKKQLFGDKPTDIVELTYIIKQDIFRIEKELKALKSIQMGNSGKDDTQVETYSKNVVQLLNTRTKNISENFKEVLQERQKSEMLQRTRQEQLLAAVKSTIGDNHDANNIPYAVRSSNNEPSLGTDNPFLASMQLQESNQKEQQNSPYGDTMLSLPDQNQQLLLLEEQNNQYLLERSSAVDAIESTINEVGGLFQQLATMVQEQGEVIQRIDENVEDVSLNITGAQRELMKFYNSVSSNRWLMLKIFGILIVFFLLWVLVS
ncbi:hypothetical protein CANINC_001459 [Pichia inconspicua]|uniref:t-SNARE coiled-coil homology domain-containing protein n=1 Tax=Pichia inconspicua TaxID=52247 RepID=A0A4T0X3L9_9ASCO|nr:hypothetical protein CANINC_001459 [[Candida] inconspicua]